MPLHFNDQGWHASVSHEGHGERSAVLTFPDAANQRSKNALHMPFLEKAVALFKIPRASVRRCTHECAAFGYTIGYMIGYMRGVKGQKGAISHGRRSRPDAVNYGAGDGTRTHDILLGSQIWANSRVSAHVLFRILVRIGYLPTSAHVRPFSSLWLHVWLHETGAIDRILKRYHVCTRAHKSNLRSPSERPTPSLFTTYPMRLRERISYQVHPRPGDCPHLPAPIPP